jgi:hypothetical protein
MPYCTIVEFEWNESLDRAGFDAMMAAAGPDGPLPEGLLTRIVGGDDVTGRVVEVWRSGADARAFAERSAPATGQMPAPSRVAGFEASSYQTR